jgi:hypothetical protein
MGIDPEDVDKVFFVFRRGRNAAAAGNVAGKGVGLASVKSIIETYNGTIGVESQLGTGSTFRFTVNGRYVPAVQRVDPAPPGGGVGASRGEDDGDADGDDGADPTTEAARASRVR